MNGLHLHLDCHPAIPDYASQHNCDDLFSSMCNAYAFKWTGLGFVNPGLQHATTLKAVRWAIASCYDPDPVLNLFIIPAPAQTSALQRLLQHPCVHVLVTIPSGTCHFTV